jgi:hypothetical protein
LGRARYIIDYIVFTLIETFEARIETQKLMELLGGDDDKPF